jgi:hypothetical protein
MLTVKSHLGRFGTTLAVCCAGILASACAATGSSPNLADETKLIRQTEARRLRSLVDADIEVARVLHADAFQLINPTGGALSKDQYLGAIESEAVDYLIWEPDSPIEVRVAGSATAVRYRSKIEIVVNGHHLPLARFWLTDTYEKLDNVWQVVWSQATEIR